MQHDRTHRIPQALAQVKQHNADILCLQEVEGGQEQLDGLLATHLPTNQTRRDNNNTTRTGYDAHVWSPMHPQRSNDLVGLAVAWRSHRFELIRHKSLWARGHIVQLRDIVSGDIVTIVNLHLPARPSAIQGRLAVIANALQQLESILTTTPTPTSSSSSSSSSALHGMVVVTGDWNSDTSSPAVQLLHDGRITPGSIQDRAYRFTLTKQLAQKFKCPRPYQFVSIYEKNERTNVAPITVSLEGRAPACVDHMFVASTNLTCTKTSSMSSNDIASIAALSGDTTSITRRKLRRLRAASSTKSSSTSVSLSPKFQIAAVLATIGIEAKDGVAYCQRQQDIIQQGLPNERHGFFTDHLPIGAMFVTTEAVTKALYNRSVDVENHDKRNLMKTPQPVADVNKQDKPVEDSAPEYTQIQPRQSNSKNGLSSAARQRRSAYTASKQIRQRHNAVLRVITDWLIDRAGATEIVRDRPLRKWKWFLDDPRSTNISQKSRAPDLCCVVPKKEGHGSQRRVIVEVTVTNKPEKVEAVRHEKLTKYQDVMDVFADPAEDHLPVEPLFVIALDASSGKVHLSTMADLQRLVGLSAAGDIVVKQEVSMLEQLLIAAVSGEQ